MASKNAKFLAIFGATLVSAALFYFGTGLHPMWWLTWFAPLPILYLAGRDRAEISSAALALAAFAALALAGLNMWHYLRALIGVPVAVSLLAVAAPAAVFAVGVLLWRIFLLRGKAWHAALFFPVFWTGISYLSSLDSPHSTFGNLAYTQMNFLPLIQIAAMTGIWGIVFLLWLLPSSIGVFLSPAAESRSKERLIVSVTFVFAIVLIAGAWRLRSPMLISGAARVQLISSDAPQDIFAVNDERALSLISRYADAVPAASSQPADVILLPEKIAKISEAAAGKAKDDLAAAAQRSGADLIVGLDELTLGGRRNEALLFGSNGSIQENYEKHHFIPVLEDGYVTGKNYVTFERPSGIWGIAICKDMDFPGLGRAYGRLGVGLLLVPAWDFTIDGWLHDRMAILRGVEGGYTIARTAKQGLQTVSDSRGRLLLDRRVFREGFVVSSVSVPVAHEDTLYDRWGDWFAWLCCAALVGLLALLASFMMGRPGESGQKK
ncbi:MAG TPA: nitrilase-related carbon-nitrogen hydrolase [Candidatus Acidoferrum sp.]|nr:nitrilase-related carbon-nitrogen hydrolase [Candidatus Acidoferrum sp.]